MNHVGPPSKAANPISIPPIFTIASGNKRPNKHFICSGVTSVPHLSAYHMAFTGIWRVFQIRTRVQSIPLHCEQSSFPMGHPNRISWEEKGSWIESRSRSLCVDGSIVSSILATFGASSPLNRTSTSFRFIAFDRSLTGPATHRNPIRYPTYCGGPNGHDLADVR